MNTKKKFASVALAAGLIISPAAQAHTRHHRHHTVCQEDQACWNCETMGNKVCGRVNVEIWSERNPYTLEDSTWVRIWDEHNRVVFGPTLVEKFEG